MAHQKHMGHSRGKLHITRHSNGQITVGCRSCLTILANYYLPLNGALLIMLLILTIVRPALKEIILDENEK